MDQRPGRDANDGFRHPECSSIAEQDIDVEDVTNLEPEALNDIITQRRQTWTQPML